ncbi:MAG: PhoH family protein [Alphaproteobacteria bacterium]|nr:PhoH family protein [Alphaproteobacteria bacterium]
MVAKQIIVKTEEFEKNQILAIVLGSCNDNARRIEKKLDVEIKNKGNQVSVSGVESNVDTAFVALNRLYKKAEVKLEIDNADIDNAVSVTKILSGDSKMKKEQDNMIQSEEDLTLKTRKRHIQPRSETQAQYVRAMRDYEMVFGLGPAGTGKTFLAVAKAVDLMEAGKIDKIILSRPAVEAGENLGFLPGDLKEKIDPYLRPLYDALYEMMPQDIVDKKLEIGEIEVAPLAFMRGRTLTNAMVILDEAQNTTPMQMKMFLTRLGENSRMIINGDLSQTDLPKGVQSGLSDALDVLRNVKSIGVVRFTEKDVVRHGLVSQIVKAYDRRYASRKGLINDDEN